MTKDKIVFNKSDKQNVGGERNNIINVSEH